MDKTFVFLEIQKQLLKASSSDALGFVGVNKTRDLVKYDQAIFWRWKGEKVTFSQASGNVTMDTKTVYAQFLGKLFTHYVRENKDGTDDSEPIMLSIRTIPESFKDDWAEHCAPFGALLLLQTEEEGVLGGLYIERKTEFQDPEKAILEELTFTMSEALALTLLREKRSLIGVWQNIGRIQKYLWMAFIVLMVFPVRLSITAPAEIVADSPVILTVPYDGMVESIDVKPGDTVKYGAVLAQMDEEQYRAQAGSAKQALEIAQASLSSARRESLSVPEKKADIQRLQSEIALKQIEFDFAQSMLDKSTITAPRDGVAVFSDANALLGRPMRMGETLLSIADPTEQEILIRVPVDAMIPIDSTAPVNFYLNVAPLQGHSAEIISIGYQAERDPDGLMTYKIRAIPHHGADDLRIGWKGSAKISGQWTILGYAILRRPLAAFRTMTGL